jgi:hypothetical protein
LEIAKARIIAANGNHLALFHNLRWTFPLGIWALLALNSRCTLGQDYPGKIGHDVACIQKCPILETDPEVPLVGMGLPKLSDETALIAIGDESFISSIERKEILHAAEQVF